MAFLEELDKNKENIQLVIFRDKTFTAYCKNAQITGYDRINPAIVKEFNDLEIPLVDASEIELDGFTLLSSFPMVQSDEDTKFEFPYSGMSYAPPEVVASMYQRAGAKIYNIEPVNIVPEMFRRLSQKEEYAASGFFNSNENDVAKAMTMEDQKTVDLPGGDKLDGTSIKDYFESARDALSELAEEAEKLDQQQKPLRYALEDGTKNPEKDKIFLELLNVRRATSHMESVLAKTGYEAALVIGGDKTDKEAVASAKSWSKNMVSANLEEYKRRGMKNTNGEHAHLYGGLKKAKQIIDGLDGPQQGLEPK